VGPDRVLGYLEERALSGTRNFRHRPDTRILSVGWPIRLDRPAFLLLFVAFSVLDVFQMSLAGPLDAIR
jgi:hypothetical protein